MDDRIETMIKNGTDFAADYLTKVLGASAKLVANVVDNADKLTRTVLDDGAKVVEATRDAFLPKA